MQSTMNRQYTELFSVNFSEEKVAAYHRKWTTQFEKNVKHRQQLDLIRSYLRPDTKWLDAPIGSGRVLNSLPCNNKTGFDNSPFFAKYNRERGIKVIEGDLLDFPFKNEFELITTMQTLANFSEFRKILVSLVNALVPGGVLITDIINKSHVERRQSEGVPYEGNEGMDPAEISEFFSALGCEVLLAEPNDYFDSPFIINLFRSPSGLRKKLGGIAYRLINRAYFSLGLYGLFERYSRGKAESLYGKYLIVIRKK